MRRTIDFIGNVLGVICALLFFAEIFYHTTNDYYFIAGKFRDLSLFGWGMMFLLWGGALYYWRKGQYALLQFVVWLLVVCFVLEWYRFLIFTGDEIYRFYLRIIIGIEIIAQVVAICRRSLQMFIYGVATFVVTVWGSIVLFPATIYLAEHVLYSVCSIGMLLWAIFQFCAMKKLANVVNIIRKLTLLTICCGVFFSGIYIYNSRVHGIRFYEQPITEAVKNPKVSVIVPVYNAEDTIERALDSLRKQTLRDIEIIAVDDGSTDDTGKILDKYAAFDKRIKVVHQKNAYAGAARNRGMEEATGEYIGFVDADDWVSLNYYEELYKKAKKDDAELVYTTKVWQIKQEFPEVRESLFQTENSMFWGFQERYNTGYVWNKIYKFDFLKEHHILFSTRRTILEDAYFSIQVKIFADKVAHLTDYAEYYYSRYKTSISIQHRRQMDYELFNIFTDLDDLIKNGGFDEDRTQKYMEFIQDARKSFLKEFYSYFSDEDKLIYKQLAKEKFPEDNIDFDKIDKNKEKNIKVSVIVPVYNGEETVRRTIDNLLNQTLKNMEIIVVDDGSTDNTPKILDKYATEYENIKVIHQKNAYVGAARNAGREQAKGEYIAFIDADDTVTEDFYEKMYQTAKENQADVVAAENVLFVWENKDGLEEPYQEREAFTENDVIEDLSAYRQEIDGYVWDKLYRKAFLDEHNIWCTLRRTPAEDNFLTTPALMFADKMYVAKGTTFYYHRGSFSETGVKHTKLSDEIVEMFTDLDEFIKSSGLAQEKIDTWLKVTAVARRRIVGNYYSCLKEEDKAVAKEKILKAFPDDEMIFEEGVKLQGKQNQLYQQI